MIRAVLAAWVMMLAGCGGGGNAPAGPAAAAPAAPAPIHAPTPAQAASAAPAAPAASAPAVAWVDLWREPWQQLSVAGWVRAENPPCAGESDPGTSALSTFGTRPDAWAAVGAVAGVVNDGRMFVDQWQGAGQGWAILSGAEFAPDKPLRLTGVIELQPDPGAWVGLTLWRSEGDYREIALHEAGGGLAVGVWAPCFLRYAVAPVPAGPQLLGIEYNPAGPVCWRYSVNGRTVADEACDERGARLEGPVRPGLFVVNLRAESRAGDGRIRASIGGLSVATLKESPP